MFKKFLCFVIIAVMCVVPSAVLAASVTPTEYPGNDANPNQFTPPAGSVRVTLPDSDQEGTHIYKFNEFGQLDPEGTDTLTLVVGTAPGTDYTQVLSWSWSGSSTLSAVIVKGGNAFNLYQYNGQTSDTNLVSPNNASGHPADISHVSVIIYPEVPPPNPPDCEITIVIEFVIILIILFIILAVNLFALSCYLCNKKHHC